MTNSTKTGSGGFTGYHKATDRAENADLRRVARGTTGGEYMRRFWHPVALSSQVQGLPKRVRVLGEDLVVFRDLSGRLGCLHLHCSHRGTSLEFGLVTERGLSCCYHGWRYDIDGTILDTPGEPAGSTIKDRICHGAYPVREHGGLIFGYFGPPELVPPFFLTDATVVPGNDLYPYVLNFDCNWLQAHENSMDPIHSVFLHTRISGVQFSQSFGALPLVRYHQTELGVISTAVRRIGDFCLGSGKRRPYAQHRPVRPPLGGRIGGETVRASGDHTLDHADRRHALYDGRLAPLQSDRRPASPHPPRRDRPGDGRLLRADASPTIRGPSAGAGRLGCAGPQRPMAIHALKNLGTTDMGIALLRRNVQRGAELVKEGKVLKPLALQDGVLPTYAHDTVLRLPQRTNDDCAVLALVGDTVTAITLETWSTPHRQRRDACIARLRESGLC